MQKVLLISYFFPPCNLTASRRIEGWVKYLHEFGYYPIVITRKWEKPIKSGKDMHFATSRGIDVIKDNHKEIHYLPYNPNFRDKIYTSNKYSIVQKLMSFLELFFQNWNIKFCPFNNPDFQKEVVPSVVCGGSLGIICRNKKFRDLIVYYKDCLK